MTKLFIRAVTIAAAGLMLLGNTWAQQTPASSSPSASTAKTQKTPAAKPHQAPAAKSQSAVVLKTQKDKASYALGMNFGSNLHKQAAEIDPAMFLQGLKDSIAGGKTLLTDDEAKAAITQLQDEVRKAEEQKMQQAAETNKKAGDAFLAANKTKDGVVTTPSGLQYKILTAGSGAKPAATDTVVCNYRGTLVDGTEFDSSYKRGQPATFPVGGVIKGWTEALQLMPVGSKWQLFVPSDLAYGERGRSPVIEPNSTLVFEVELVSIQPAKSQ